MSADAVMYRGGPDRSGVTGSADPPEGFAPWGRRVAGPVLCAPVVADDTVYVADAGGRLSAFGALDGTRRWTHSPLGGKALVGPPVVHAGTIYLGGGDGLLALAAATGEARWSYATGVPVTAAPAVADGRVFLLAEGPRLVALREADGRPLWMRKLGALNPSLWDLVREVNDSGGQPEFLGSPPAIAARTVYVAGPDNTLYAVSAASGEVRWQRPLKLGLHAGCAVADGRVYAAGTDGRLCALAVADGREQWSVDTRLRVDRVVPVVVGDLVYVAGRAMSPGPPLLTSGAVQAYDRETGALRWRRPTAAWVEAPLAVGHGRLIFTTRGTALNDAELTAVDAGDGRRLWWRPVEHRSGHPTDTRNDGLRAAPTVHDGVLYLGMPSGSLQTLDAATGTDGATLGKKRRMRQRRPVGPWPSRDMVHLTTGLWAVGTLLPCLLVATLVEGPDLGPLIGLLATPVVMVLAQLLGRAAFNAGARLGERRWFRAAAVVSGLALAAMQLVPPARRFAQHRVRAMANIGWALAEARLAKPWQAVAAGHLAMAEALARRFPSDDTTVLRAQAEAMVAEGHKVFNTWDQAARHAAHAVDLYLAADAFRDPRYQGHARYMDAMYGELGAHGLP